MLKVYLHKRTEIKKETAIAVGFIISTWGTKEVCTVRKLKTQNSKLIIHLPFAKNQNNIIGATSLVAIALIAKKLLHEK